MSPTSQIPPSSRTSLFDSCHRKIRLIGGGPVAFLGGLVAKARRKEREGDHNSTDTKLYLEESVLERKLPEADLKALVDLPAGLDYNEWLASHTLALFEHVNLVYGTISEFCTPSGCADMTGPGNRTYLWFDEKGKKTRVAAPQYIDYVMTFTQKTVSDESIFPTKYANEFPSSFESIARKILRLQFHVIAHLYAAHFREIALLGLHTHLNLTFAHLTALHRRFTLIDEKETDVLRDLEVALRLTDDSNSQSAQSENNQASVAVATSTTTTFNESGESSNSKQIMEEVNSRVQHNNISVLSSLIFESKQSVPPICTQPEATTKSQQHFNSIGLMSGILGDLSTGELSYCASPVPAYSFSATSNSSPSCTSSYTVDGMITSAPGVNNDAEAGTLHFNFNHNSNNNNNNSQYHTHHLLHHVHAHQNLYTPNSGLIQCNATNAPSAVNTTSSTTA